MVLEAVASASLHHRHLYSQRLVVVPVDAAIEETERRSEEEGVPAQGAPVVGRRPLQLGGNGEVFPAVVRRPWQ